MVLWRHFDIRAAENSLSLGSGATAGLLAVLRKEVQQLHQHIFGCDQFGFRNQFAGSDGAFMPLVSGVEEPDPIVRVDWPESLVAAMPSATFISPFPQQAPSGQRGLRFNTVVGWNYRVQGADAVSGPWANVSDSLPGNDSNIEWPIPPSSEPANQFWRVEVTPQGD